MPGLPYKDGDDSEEQAPISMEEQANERLALLNRYSEATKDILMEKGLIGSIQGEIFVFNGTLGFQVCIIDSHNDVPQDMLMFVCPVSTGFPPVLLEKDDFEYEKSYGKSYSFSVQYHEGIVSPVTQHFAGEFDTRGNISTMVSVK